ncbi:MAG: metallophosphoesterase [Paludibacteraceae bacterium]|nr:metallophosphoesterase [Paludibacteraceae bacterium]
MIRIFVSFITFISLFLPINAVTYMCVEQKDGKIVDFDVDDIHQVYCKEGDAHIDSTSNLLTISGFIDKSVKATSSTDMKSVLSKAVKEINKIDPSHKYLRIAVVSDMHSVPDDSDSQSISLYKGTSCNDNIVLFGKVVEELDCDAGFALGDYSDNRIAFSKKNTQVSGGVDKYKEETRKIINELRNSHARPMFFTMGNHEFGDGLKGQVYNADMCNRIIQTCNRPGSNKVNYLNGKGYAYSVSFTKYKINIAVDCDGNGISNGWGLADDIYMQTPETWTVGCMIHGSTTDALNGRHDGVFTNHYTFSENNIKSFGVIRGHVHDSGQVGFDEVSTEEENHSLVCPRLSVPASYYDNDSVSDNDHFCVTVFIFDTDKNRTNVVRLGREEWGKYVESSKPSFPYSYDFIINDK